MDRAAQVIADNISTIQDPIARGGLLERLGRLREHLKDPSAAGEAYGAAADLQKTDKLWEAAERCFVAAGRWDRAAQGAVERAHAATNPKLQAQHFARAAEHFARAGDEAGVLGALERSTDLDPTSDEHAQQLSERYTALGKWAELVRLLVTRGDRLTDKAKRTAVRRQAAKLYQSQLGDAEAARETWWKVIEDGDDKEAIEHLIEDAVTREDHVEATTLLRRLGKLATDSGERVRIALREAEILAEGVGDVDAAIARYERVLSEIDPACRPALQAVADLQEARENPTAAVGALERELQLATDSSERVQIAWRMARLYEQLDDGKSAIRSLELVRELDREDFDALTRLCDLWETAEEWEKTAELLAQRIEVEADDGETSALTQKLATVLADRLDRGDEALAALTELGDMGDEAIRIAYVRLGDRLGWRGIVATKLVDWWFEAEQSPKRIANLRGAFERFVEVGREQEAVRVACEIARSRGADRALAEQLEQLSIKTRDLDALSVAHDFIVRDLAEMQRARELARQAEARAQAGAPPLEALQHGEAGLSGVPPEDAEEILERLAAIAPEPSDIVDLYERQITRCKTPTDRVRALARAAQVAASRGDLERARRFFDLALSGTPTEEMLATLEQAAVDGDAKAHGEDLRRTLCEAMAAGGQGARDGGRTRGSLMRRAASIVYRGLKDVDQAFTWFGDSLIAHVDPSTLDALEELADDVGDPHRTEAALSRALGEVFDGPLVRQLLARRAKLRREKLDDKVGAATDLRKLHELSPGDQSVTEELTTLLTQLGDQKGMVQLYEDLILRGKDVVVRTELARKVARMWEDELADPREAADAWRRVLRMKSGDAEATEGLERAKANMLRKPKQSPDVEVDAVPSAQPPQSAPRMIEGGSSAPTAAAESGYSREEANTPVPDGDTDASEATVSAPTRSEPASADAMERTGHPRKREKGEENDEAEPAAAVEASPDTRKSALALDRDEPLSLDLDPPEQSVAVEGELVIAEDIGEMIEVEEAVQDKQDSPRPIPENGKRSLPPPLRRG